MMPCKLCTPFENGVPILVREDGTTRRGLKQRGKTKRSDVAWKNKYGEGTAEQARGERIYVCQDCGALWRLTFNGEDRTSREEPVLKLVEGGGER